MHENAIFKSNDSHKPYNMLWLCRTLLVASMRAAGISGLAAPPLQGTLARKKQVPHHRITTMRLAHALCCGLLHEVDSA
jgi:hypothetical protein